MVLLLLGLCGLAPTEIYGAQKAEGDAAPPATRIVRPVDEQDRVTLDGNRYPLARPESDFGPVRASQPLERMVLVLRPGSEQQTALNALLVAQQDRSSSLYHHWLTPEQFGERFGVSTDDLSVIEGWLGSRGLRVDLVPAGRQSIVFSGAAAEVEAAFHTTLRRYFVAGEVHFANASDPEVPSSLAPVIEGIVSLHDFRSRGMHSIRGRAAPEFTTGAYHYLAPADFASIYNVESLYEQGLDGLGESIAIAARSDIDIEDVHKFRRAFNLPARDPVVVASGHDPGLGSSEDQAEATLAVEWAGGVAPNATVLLVPAASTGSTDGVFLSAQDIVNGNLAPILSLSYALCEARLGAAGNSFFKALWQQAAAQGITVLVAAGDSGAAGCDDPAAATASSGRAVNGMCSTPDSTCVGGTEFDDIASPSLYWNAANGASSRTAIGYIPEMAWNESAGTRLTEPSGFSLGTGLWASGGGTSNIYAKPAWQGGLGVPADGRRDVPDVSFSAAAHVGYLIELNGSLLVFNGTSLATPAFAGLLAVVEQGAGGAQGNINPTLYAAAASFTGDSVGKAFHDATGGDNSVPGLAGYAAGPGYDLVTGLGSVDAAALAAKWAANWDAAGKPPSLRLAASRSDVGLVAGVSSAVTVSVVTDDGSVLPSSYIVTLSVDGLPPGVKSRYVPGATGVPGQSRLILSATKTATPGSYSAYVVATVSGPQKPIMQQPILIHVTILPSRGIRHVPGAQVRAGGPL